MINAITQTRNCIGPATRRPKHQNRDKWRTYIYVKKFVPVRIHYIDDLETAKLKRRTGKRRKIQLKIRVHTFYY